MPDGRSDIKAIDFFCCAGGMTEGFEQAGIKVIAGIDIDPVCKETYEKNHPNSTFILSDIKKLPSNYFKNKFSVQKNDPGLIMIGCSPCQHWSKINTERGKSEKSKNLLLDFTRFIRYYKPGYIVIENVPGIESKPEESGLKKFLNFLNKHEYKYKKQKIDMSQYKVPQKRVRFVLLATKNRKDLLFPEISEHKTALKDYIKKLPKIKAGEKYKDFPLHRAASISNDNLKRLQKTPHNGGTRMAWKDDPDLQINAYKNKDNIFKDVYGRMKWEEPAPTITTKFNSISNGRFGHPEQNRALSLLEGSLLQTFSEKYTFSGNTNSAIAKQIGNAVPPLFALQIASKILEHYQSRL